MTLKEISSVADFDKEINKNILTVAKFSADWCGPCRQIAPFVENLSRKYPNVNFFQVDADKSPIATARAVSALPTFQFYINGRMIDEIKGANPGELENKVIKYKVDPVQSFAGSGFTLGAATDSDQSGLSLREARLKAFQIASNPIPTSTTPANASSQPMDVEADEDLAKAIALSIEEAQSTGGGKLSGETSLATKVNDKAIEQDKLDTAEAEAEQAREDAEWGEEMVSTVYYILSI